MADSTSQAGLESIRRELKIGDINSRLHTSKSTVTVRELTDPSDFYDLYYPHFLENFSKRNVGEIECQRMVNVLDDVMKRSEVSWYAAYLMANLNKEKAFLPVSLVRMLEKLKKSVEGGQCHGKDRGSINLKYQIRDGHLNLQVKDIIRAIILTPRLLQILRENSKRYKSRRTLALLNHLKALRDVKNYQLLTTGDEDEKFKQFLNFKHHLQEAHLKELQELKQEAALITQTKQTELSRRTDLISSLEADLDQLMKGVVQNIRRVRVETDLVMEECGDMSLTRQRKLEENMSQLTSNLTNLQTQNRSGEEALRKKKFMTESELDEAIAKYDQEMHHRQDLLEELQKAAEEKRVAFTKLESVYADVEKEYEIVLQEQRIIQEKSDQQLRLNMAKLHAIFLIQRWFIKWRKEHPHKKKAKGKRKLGKGEVK